MNANAPARTAAAAAALLVGFFIVGFLGISAPPVLHGIDAVQRWATTRTLTEVVMGSLRLGGQLMCAYLLAVSVVALAARATRWRWLVRAANLATPSRLRPSLGVVLGASVAAGVVASMMPRSAPPPTIATMYAEEPELPVRAPFTTTAGTARVELPAWAAATDLGNAAISAPAGNAAELGAIGAELESGRTDAAAPSETPPAWLIRPGDNLWLVAEETLEDAWGRQPTDAEIVPYWHRLIELNRDVLVVRDAPDFVYSGQVFELPRVPNR